MAKKLKVSKTQAVRDYLKDHPAATSGEISAALSKQGIKMTPAHAANIKSKENKARLAKKAAKKHAAVEPSVPAVEAPTKNGGTITLEQVKKVALLHSQGDGRIPACGRSAGRHQRAGRREEIQGSGGSDVGCGNGRHSVLIDLRLDWVR